MSELKLALFQAAARTALLTLFVGVTAIAALAVRFVLRTIWPGTP